MRKQLLSLFLLLSIALYSQNNLRLLSATGEPFKVSIKSKQVNKFYEANVLIENIKQDTIELNFEFENKIKVHSSFILLNRGIKDSNKEHEYIISLKNNELKKVFVGISEIIQPPKTIVPSKKKVDSTTYFKNQLSHFCELKNGDYIFYNNIPNTQKCNQAMPEEYLKYCIGIVTKITNQEKKLFQVLETVKNNCLSTTQLANILNLLETDFDKLTVVKIAYYNLVDTTNKIKFLNTFKTEVSKNEAINFISKSKEYKNVYGKFCSSPSTETEIELLMKRLKDLSNDNQRIDLLNKIYIHYCLNTASISEIMELVFHDREKLEIAKLVYYKCFNRADYRTLKKNFSFEISMNSLEEFLMKQER